MSGLMSGAAKSLNPHSLNFGHPAQQANSTTNYPSAVSAPPPPPRTLPEIAKYQHELLENVLGLGNRLAAIVAMLDGTSHAPLSGEIPSQRIEETAPISAIITRTQNTQDLVNACGLMVSMIEQRIGG